MPSVRAAASRLATTGAHVKIPVGARHAVVGRRCGCEPDVTEPERADRPTNVAISCVLADDHPAVLEAVSRVLREHGIDVVATSTDGESAVAAILEHKPQVAIIDIKMGRLSGVEATRRIGTDTHVILYTGYRDRTLLLDGLDAGARAIVLKEAPLDDLVRAVRTVAEGGVYLDPVLAGVLITTETTKALTERERSVLRLLADGYRNDSIGSALAIAPDTVRAHVRNAMRKLEVDTRTQAVAEALRRSLID